MTSGVISLWASNSVVLCRLHRTTKDSGFRRDLRKTREKRLMLKLLHPPGTDDGQEEVQT